MTKMDKLWLPTGVHYDLHIDHHPVQIQSGFVPAHWKAVLHTTEGPTFQGGSDALVNENAEPHLLFGRMPDGSHRVRQFIPFNQSARALEHPPGTGETNRARAIQVEIAGYAKDSHDWPDSFYDALARMFLLVEHRVPIPRKVPRTFSDTPNRYTPVGWLGVSGYVGHQHAPSQTQGHWDPGAFRGRKLIQAMDAEAR